MYGDWGSNQTVEGGTGDISRGVIRRSVGYFLALAQNIRDMRLANDAVIVCVGGVLPTSFLREAGVEIEVRHGS